MKGSFVVSSKIEVCHCVTRVNLEKRQVLVTLPHHMVYNRFRRGHFDENNCFMQSVGVVSVSVKLDSSLYNGLGLQMK